MITVKLLGTNYSEQTWECTLPDGNVVQVQTDIGTPPIDIPNGDLEVQFESMSVPLERVLDALFKLVLKSRTDRVSHLTKFGFKIQGIIGA